MLNLVNNKFNKRKRRKKKVKLKLKKRKRKKLKLNLTQVYHLIFNMHKNLD